MSHEIALYSKSYWDKSRKREIEQVAPPVLGRRAKRDAKTGSVKEASAPSEDRAIKNYSGTAREKNSSPSRGDLFGAKISYQIPDQKARLGATPSRRSAALDQERST